MWSLCNDFRLLSQTIFPSAKKRLRKMFAGVKVVLVAVAEPLALFFCVPVCVKVCVCVLTLWQD